MLIIGWVLIIIGTFAILSGIVGLFRFKCFYNKLHAAGVIDSCGLPFSLLGLACLQNDWSSSFKLLFAVALILLLSPLSTNIIGRAALLKEEKEYIKRIINTDHIMNS
ncbi:MAG: monovalent cation/H(+) antiporter subunit G [Janthinobacterium lividum]